MPFSLAPLVATRFPRPIHRLQLFVRERPLELLLERAERGGSCRAARAARHHEPQRPIKIWYLRLRERSRELLRQPQSRYHRQTLRGLLDVILNFDVAIANLHAIRKLRILRANGGRNKRIELRAQIQISVSEIGQRADLAELPRV